MALTNALAFPMFHFELQRAKNYMCVCELCHCKLQQFFVHMCAEDKDRASERDVYIGSACMCAIIRVIAITFSVPFSHSQLSLLLQENLMCKVRTSRKSFSC